MSSIIFVVVLEYIISNCKSECIEPEINPTSYERIKMIEFGSFYTRVFPVKYVLRENTSRIRVPQHPKGNQDSKLIEPFVRNVKKISIVNNSETVTSGALVCKYIFIKIKLHECNVTQSKAV